MSKIIIAAENIAGFGYSGIIISGSNEKGHSKRLVINSILSVEGETVNEFVVTFFDGGGHPANYTFSRLSDAITKYNKL